MNTQFKPYALWPEQWPCSITVDGAAVESVEQYVEALQAGKTVEVALGPLAEKSTVQKLYLNDGRVQSDVYLLPDRETVRVHDEYLGEDIAESLADTLQVVAEGVVKAIRLDAAEFGMEETLQRFNGVKFVQVSRILTGSVDAPATAHCKGCERYAECVEEAKLLDPAFTEYEGEPEPSKQAVDEGVGLAALVGQMLGLDPKTVLDIIGPDADPDAEDPDADNSECDDDADDDEYSDEWGPDEEAEEALVAAEQEQEDEEASR